MNGLKKIVKIVSNKGVIVLDKYIDVFQSHNNIYVTKLTTSPEYYVFHELIHYIVSSNLNRKKYNLRFGKKNNFGYSMPKSDELEECLKEERIVGELQYYIFKKAKLKNILFPDQPLEIVDSYFKYIININKPIDEPSLLSDGLKRLKETNLEKGIDILDMFKQLSSQNELNFTI